VQSLESRLEDDKQLNLQVELLKKDKSKLISQLTAQESVIDGLRAERKIWGQELAQQGTVHLYRMQMQSFLFELSFVFVLLLRCILSTGPWSTGGQN